MTNYLELIQNAKSLIRDAIIKELEEGAKSLFEKYKDMESFGWHQYVDRWVDSRDVVFLESLKKPDISGSLGELIFYDKDGRQAAVAEFLERFDPVLLQVAFGSCDVAMYRDGIETNDDKYEIIEL